MEKSATQKVFKMSKDHPLSLTPSSLKRSSKPSQSREQTSSAATRSLWTKASSVSMSKLSRITSSFPSSTCHQFKQSKYFNFLLIHISIVTTLPYFPHLVTSLSWKLSTGKCIHFSDGYSKQLLPVLHTNFLSHQSTLFAKSLLCPLRTINN